VSGSSLRSFGSLLLHQLVTRVATFVLNLLVARHIGPAAYGIANVQFYLLNTLILFGVREAPRRASLRYAPPAGLAGRDAAIYERRVLLNLSWLSVALAIPVCVAVRAAFLATAPAFEEDTAADAAGAVPLSVQYTRCLTLYTAASFVELLAEPLYVWYQKRQRVRVRVMIDGAAVLLRCAVTFLSLLAAHQTGGGGHLLAFAYGQMAFAATIVAGYYSLFLHEVLFSPAVDQRKEGDASMDYSFRTLTDLLPARLPSLPVSPSSPGSKSSGRAGLLSSFMDPPLFRLTREVLVQSLEKLCLQEGEKLVLVWIAGSLAGGAGSSATATSDPASSTPSSATGASSASEAHLRTQGVYGLIQNLGSLVARLLFQPLEEAAFMEFSMGFAGVTRAREGKDAAEKEKKLELRDGEDDDAVASSPSAAASSTSFSSLSSAYTTGLTQLSVLLHVVLLVGLTLLCFGPGYSFVFLDLLYGARWSAAETGAAQLLSAYCGYILLMALNGVSEAFVSAVISTRELRHYNLWLVLCSALYVAACAALLRFGALGLIAANCANMALRIGYSAWFIRRFFRSGKEEIVRGETAGEQGDTDAHQQLSISHARTLALPSTATLCAFVASVVATQASLAWFGFGASSATAANAASLSLLGKLVQFGPHIAVGVACLAVVAAAVYRTERAFLAQVAQLAGARRKRKQA